MRQFLRICECGELIRLIGASAFNSPNWIYNWIVCKYGQRADNLIFWRDAEETSETTAAATVWTVASLILPLSYCFFLFFCSLSLRLSNSSFVSFLFLSSGRQSGSQAVDDGLFKLCCAHGRATMSKRISLMGQRRHAGRTFDNQTKKPNRNKMEQK